jgi:hypothetical protein
LNKVQAVIYLFMIYFTRFSVYQDIQLQNVRWMVNGNSKRIWKERYSCCNSIRMLRPAITLQICKNIQPYFRNSKETPPEYRFGSWPTEQPARDTMCKRNIYDLVFEKSYFCRAQIWIKSGARFLNKLCAWENHWLGMCNCNRNTQRRERFIRKNYVEMYTW